MYIFFVVEANFIFFAFTVMFLIAAYVALFTSLICECHIKIDIVRVYFPVSLSCEGSNKYSYLGLTSKGALAAEQMLTMGDIRAYFSLFG
ncbi:hypothetical protein RB195_025508 [Necator americanus]|uniref:Uncharacterized protein n=1 Tax=Necator americanus TaxID=51031 RepID=A0ABR1ESK8_NECAM